MRRIAIPALLAASLLAACTPMQWVRQDTGPEQLDQDMTQCRQEAWREARWHAWSYHPFGPSWVQDARGRRFLVWPDTVFGDPFGDRFMEESRLEDFCMRNKGYQLVPVEPERKS
jgi:hypothetical protein